MALNADVGASEANSYVTEEEADAYFEDRSHADAWEEFENKEAALVTASRMLDWYVSWKGYRSSDVQSMLWPRMSVLRRDGSEVASDTIPAEVKTAVYELALSSLEDDRTSDDPLAGIEQVKLSSLMIKADSGDYDSTSAAAIPEKVWKILSDLYSRSGFGVVRLVRG